MFIATVLEKETQTADFIPYAPCTSGNPIVPGGVYMKMATTQDFDAVLDSADDIVDIQELPAAVSRTILMRYPGSSLPIFCTSSGGTSTYDNVPSRHSRIVMSISQLRVGQECGGCEERV